MVLEDDVCPKENVKYLDEMINSFCSSKCLYFSGTGWSKSFSRVIMGKINMWRVRKSNIKIFYRWLYRTCCCVLDIKGAERILLRLMEENSFFVMTGVTL